MSRHHEIRYFAGCARNPATREALCGVPEKTNAQRIQDRIEKSEATQATFARIGEEFKTIRKATPVGPARDRIDNLIDLNTQTAATVRRSRGISERALGREKAQAQARRPVVRASAK